MDTQFKKFLQIGIIVADAEATMKHYESIGIGPWRVADFDSAVFEDFQMNGKKAHVHMLMCYCNIWGFELELIQPLNDSPYKEWLDQHGPGMHHIAVVSRDGFDKVLEMHKEMTGKEAWMHCQEPNVGMDFAYLDFSKELGIFLEVYNEEKKGGLDANFKVPDAE